MEITKDKIVDVLYESIGELNEQRSSDLQLVCSPQTPLGVGAGLDSLSFVNFLAMVEEKCSERFGRNLALSTVEWKEGLRDPFETVSSLAEFIELALVDGQASSR